MSDVHAAIDIGTNSFHLVVARATPSGGGYEVVTTEKEMVRLGEGLGQADNSLSSAAIERGVTALQRMVDVATSFGADVTAVATSAVREAENGREFVDRVRAEVGLDIDVISGYEEARLIHRGVIHAVPVADRRLLLVDIGGGSTEFIIGEHRELVEARSLRLGAIRLSRTFFPDAADSDDPPRGKAIRECRAFLRDTLAGVSRDLGGHQPEVAVGSSGTISAAASMVAARRGQDGKQLNGFTFDAEELAAVVEEVVGSGAADRRRIPGLDQRRADIIVGGVLLLEEIFHAFHLDAMTISSYALREGVLYDRFPVSDDHLQDLRRSNAMRLARQLDPDIAHAEHVARLAVQMFDRTSQLHGLDEHARELLEVAALVHNVGMAIARSGHHKHAYYIIRHSEVLTGLSEQETELVALTARFHRKSHPADKHAEFVALDPDDQHLVRVLAGILRIAIGLDRRHAGHVVAVGVQVEEAGDDGRQALVVEPVVSTSADVDVEVEAARARASLLSEALERPVVIRLRASSPSGIESS